MQEEIYNGLLDLSSELESNSRILDILRVEDLIRILRKKRINSRLIPYIKMLFDKYNYEENKETIYKDLNTVAHNFNSSYYVNYANLKQILHLHTRNDDYDALNEILLDNNVHEPDNFIFLDAHDLCTCINNSLTFVTADSIPERNLFIESNTSIHKIKDLREYTL